ncbi:hypothetical protein TNCV_1782741 [Trichonephila clavipes]|nr:hypothetical protein TNCV_1782741 [Trichonephila clavipes]
MEFYHHLSSWAMNEQMSYFSSFSDEWSRDLKSVQVQKQRSCRVYVPIGLATGGQVKVVHQQVLCAFGRSFGRRRVASTRGFGYVERSQSEERIHWLKALRT